ncbi:Protein of unknown function [Gryllus bimaculatus]|nr:Protein of unknown function [Gryllus bimaculatus]
MLAFVGSRRKTPGHFDASGFCRGACACPPLITAPHQEGPPVGSWRPWWPLAGCASSAPPSCPLAQPVAPSDGEPARAAQPQAPPCLGGPCDPRRLTRTAVCPVKAPPGARPSSARKKTLRRKL